MLRNVIQDQLFFGGNFERLKDAIIRRAEMRSSGSSSADIATRLKDAKAKLDRAGRNLLNADDENFPILNKMMSEMRQTVKTLEAEVAIVQKSGDPRVLAKAVVERAGELSNELILAKPDRLTAVFARLIERVELKFKSAAWDRRQIRQVAGCDLYLRDSLTIEYRGDSRCTIHNQLFRWLAASVPLIRIRTA